MLFKSCLPRELLHEDRSVVAYDGIPSVRCRLHGWCPNQAVPFPEILHGRALLQVCAHHGPKVMNDLDPVESSVERGG